MKNEQVPMQILGMWKSAWETYVKTIKVAEEQSDRVLDLMLQQSSTLQEVTRNLVKDWVNNSKNLGNSYLDAVEQNVSKIEGMLEPR